MQCTDVIRMDLPLGMVMISTHRTTFETTKIPTPDVVPRTQHPQDTQLVTVVFFTGGLISLQRTWRYSLKRVVKKNTLFQG